MCVWGVFLHLVNNISLQIAISTQGTCEKSFSQHAICKVTCLLRNTVSCFSIFGVIVCVTPNFPINLFHYRVAIFLFWHHTHCAPPDCPKLEHDKIIHIQLLYLSILILLLLLLALLVLWQPFLSFTSSYFYHLTLCHVLPLHPSPPLPRFTALLNMNFALL